MTISSRMIPTWKVGSLVKRGTFSCQPNLVISSGVIGESWVSAANLHRGNHGARPFDEVIDSHWISMGGNQGGRDDLDLFSLR